MEDIHREWRTQDTDFNKWQIFASLSAIFYFLPSTPELGPQNPSLGRKFAVESDFQVKNSQFQHLEANI